MTPADFEKVACAAALDGGALLRRRFRQRAPLLVELKGEHDFVTEVDRQAEAAVLGFLKARFPAHAYMSEEDSPGAAAAEYRWVIDPLDGTTNFIHGACPFAISVGLLRHEEVVAGIVYEFGLNEYFYSWKGGGAWCNGKRIRVSGVGTVNQALIATGFPYTDFSYIDEFLESMAYFMEYSHGLRRLGSAATDMAYVACGRYDGFYEYGLHAWDIAAGILLIREAGGMLSDFRGNENPLFSETIVCSNGLIQEEFLSATQKIMLK
jgi:myo-inositol-1(or 4)-monophosphatase